MTMNLLTKLQSTILLLVLFAHGTFSQAGDKDTVYLIDLATVLRLAKADSLQIKAARARITEAESKLDKAKLTLIPDLSIGASVYRHDGPLQETNGNILDVNRSAAQAGLGSGATGAGNATVPGLVLQADLADTLYDPLAARQNVAAARADLLAQRNEALLAAVNAYFELLRAKGNFSVARESFSNAGDLHKTTSTFAETGEGLESDAARVEVEKLVQERNVEQAREQVALSSIELARLLRLSPTTQLEPRANRVVPVNFVTLGKPVNHLIATALENNPVIAREKALVERATTELRKAKNAPLIPSVAVTSSFGTFLGGSEDRLDNDGARADLNAAIYWNLQALGLGDRADKNVKDAVLRQRIIEKLKTMDQIAADVASAHVSVLSRRRQIAIGERAINRGRKAYDLNRSRIFEKQGLPIEALQSIQSLDVASRLYINTVIDYNCAQYALFNAMGQAVVNPGTISQTKTKSVTKKIPRAVPIERKPSEKPKGIFSKLFKPSKSGKD